MRPLIIPILALLLTSCAGIQSDKMARNKIDIDAYLAALSNPGVFSAQSTCSTGPTLNEWYEAKIDQSTAVVSMPSGRPAAPICIKIPVGATELVLHSNGVGGATYYSTTMAFPSTQFLADDFSLIEDFPKPRNIIDAGILSGFALTSEYDLTKNLAHARYMLIYVHPASLDSGVQVVDGIQHIWVPYAPYGEFRMRFRKK